MQLVGTVVSSPDPVLAERLASAFDFVWIDLEHSALSLGDAQLLAIAARAGGAYSLIRLPCFDSEALTAALDMGVDGVVAPKVASFHEAQWLAASVQYPPRGTRGFAPRRAQVTRSPSNGRLEARVAVVVQIETRVALANLDEIAATEGVDALVVGTNDLSLDLGHTLDVDSPELAEAVTRVGDAARHRSRAWGLAISSMPEWASAAFADGAGMFVFSSDTQLYTEAVERSAARVRSLPGRSQALSFTNTDQEAP